MEWLGQNLRRKQKLINVVVVHSFLPAENPITVSVRDQEGGLSFGVISFLSPLHLRRVLFSYKN